MLDKSIPFHTIIMKRPYSKINNIYTLPKGYSLKSYEPGDEMQWAEIETSVLEFDSVEKALECHKGYLDRVQDLRKRQWFVKSDSGILAATATAWTIEHNGKKIPVVHALACRPEYQGRGLGKAVAAKMLEVFYELDEGCDIWLDTQTWSYQAIGLYMDLGFIPMRTAVFIETENEFEKACPILQQKMTKEQYIKFIDIAL